MQGSHENNQPISQLNSRLNQRRNDSKTLSFLYFRIFDWITIKQKASYCIALYMTKVHNRQNNNQWCLISNLTTTEYNLAVKKLRAKNAKTGMLLHIFFKIFENVFFFFFFFYWVCQSFNSRINHFIKRAGWWYSTWFVGIVKKQLIIYCERVNLGLRVLKKYLQSESRRSC